MKIRTTKQDWIDAGDAAKDIDLASVEETLGHTIPKRISHFEDLCAFVVLSLTGEKIPACNLRGRGFRSQWHGQEVAKVWPEP